MNYLGIEIGGTKLQAALGKGDGVLSARRRAVVDPSAGAAGIRNQMAGMIAELRMEAGVNLRGAAIGFGGPVDLETGKIIVSHQIAGWDDFPLKAWLTEASGVPSTLANDADTAGLGEAVNGAGRGRNPIFYITIGSGIGGGLIVDGTIHRGVGRGAAEIGHLWVGDERRTLESYASGWGIERTARERFGKNWKGPEIAAAARSGDETAVAILETAIRPLAEAIRHVVCLLCPQRIIIGGGVSLMGKVFFEPLRKIVAENAFPPFAGLTDIVPAELGEDVVLHGAIELAKGAG